MQDLLIRVFGFPAKLRLLKSHAPSREPPDEVRRGRTAAIEFDPKSREDIPPILRGLQPQVLPG